MAFINFLGTIKNIASPPKTVDIKNLGWTLGTGVTQSVDSDTVSFELLRQAENEISLLIAAGDIEVKTSKGTIITAGQVGDWVAPVVTEIIPGVGIAVSSTGIDPGERAVTVSSDVNAVQRFFSTLPAKVPGSGEIFLRHDGDIAYSEVPIVLVSNFQLQEVSIAVDVADSSNNYTVRFYTDPAGSPVLQHSPLTLTSGNLTASVTGLSLAVNSGNWGVALARTLGSGSSDFDNVVVSFLLVKV